MELSQEINLFEHGDRLKVSPAHKRENVRSYIALIFVIAFFIVIGIGFLIGYNKSFEVKDYSDMLIAISGVLSGPLGFIIGFYFKDSADSSTK